MMKCIPVSELKLGMFVQELHGSWLKHPFWKTKFLLEDIEDLTLLKTCGIAEISIDPDKSICEPSRPPRSQAIPANNQTTSSMPIRPAPKTSPASLQEEAARAQELCNQSKKAVTDMFREARMGKAIAMDTAHEVVEQITASVERHPQALITLARLKTADDYTYMHSVAVCAMMIDVCLHHHEKIDGSGYPHGLKEGQISRLARMGAICDVYDAITSNRPYKKGWGPAESIQRIAQWKGHFGADLLKAFIKAIGIYPVGSLVRLSSQRLALWNFPYLNDLKQSAL